MQTSQKQFLVPSSSQHKEDLLFFDTFSHSSSEQKNFDLVQFPTPVVVESIKIVPLGQPIEAKIPGNVRLGATNPSNCELEFFINDLTKHDAHTFTDLGKFACSEKETEFTPPFRIQTDGLLLRGGYRTLTLAIFGQTASLEEKPIEEDMTISSPPVQTPASPVCDDRGASFANDSDMIRNFDQEPENDRVAYDVYDQLSSKSEDLTRDEVFSDARPEQAPNELSLSNLNSSSYEPRDNNDDLSSSEGIPNEKITLDFINSNDACSIRKEPVTHVEQDYSKSYEEDKFSKKDEENSEDSIMWSSDCDITVYRPEPLEYFTDPSLTPQELSIISEQRTKSAKSRHNSDTEKELKRLEDAFDRLNCPDGSKSDDWVILIEALTNDIKNLSLSQFLHDQDVLNCLIQEVCHGLDFELALQQKVTTFKVRHLRAGLKLATVLFHCGELAVQTLINHSVCQKVLALFEKEQMSLPLKLLIFRCLSAACDSNLCLEHIISHKYEWPKSSLSLKYLRDIHKNIKIESNSESHEMHQDFDGVDNANELENHSSNNINIDKPSDTNNESITCYQYILKMLLSNPKTRIIMAIGNLLKKIRLYKNFVNLTFIADSINNIDDSNNNEKISKLKGATECVQDILILTKNGCTNINQPIRHLPAKTQFQVRPSRSDPYICVYKWFKHFQILDCIHTLLNHVQTTSPDHEGADDYLNLQSLCLEFLRFIIDSPRGPHLLLSKDCYIQTETLLELLMTENFVKRSSHLSVDGVDNYSKASFMDGQVVFRNRCIELAFRMAYSLKVYSCIDKLFAFHRDIIVNEGNSSVNDPELVLHELLILSDHPFGLAGILKHFCYIGNLDCLLRFLDMPGFHKQLEFVKEISIDYSLELLGIFFKFNNNVLEISEEYLETVLDLSKTKDKNLSTRIQNLIPWLTPFETSHTLPLITYSEETFKALIKVLRKCIPNYSIPFAKGLNYELPPQMITAVRILRQLSIPPQVENYLANVFDTHSSFGLGIDKCLKPSSSMLFVDSFPHYQNLNLSWNLYNQVVKNPSESAFCDEASSESQNQINQTFKLFQPYKDDIVGELKYHFGMMQIIEHGGLKRLLNTLRELTGNYPKPINQSSALCGLRGRVVLSYIDSVVVLLHSIVSHLIDARGSEFKDSSVIPVVLEIYSILCFTPKPNSIHEGTFDLAGLDAKRVLQKSVNLMSENYLLAQQSKKVIISILMSYTQLCLSVSESEDKVISKSMWTKMLKEVIEFTNSAPIFFLHGLEVLTKILPPPLLSPSMMDSIDQEQLFRNINHRKLWSAHLHPIYLTIEQMISQLSFCHHRGIRNLLIYFCQQLNDLSSTAASIVARSLIDTLITFAFKHSKNTSQHPDSEANIASNQQQSNGQASSPSICEKDLPSWTGDDECLVYIFKMLLNLISILLANKAFETAFTNHFHVACKKDEKILSSLRQALSLFDEFSTKQTEESAMTFPTTSAATVASQNLLEDIFNLANSIKEATPATLFEPPDKMTKINLMELSRKTSDRFSISSGLKKSYRLKVLIDLTTNSVRRSSESATKRNDTTAYKSDPVPPTGSSKRFFPPPPSTVRGRSSRPDAYRSDPSAFRTRAHNNNSSRPASIHVDDFMSNSYHNRSASRYQAQRKLPPPSALPSSRYRY